MYMKPVFEFSFEVGLVNQYVFAGDLCNIRYGNANLHRQSLGDLERC